MAASVARVVEPAGAWSTLFGRKPRGTVVRCRRYADGEYSLSVVPRPQRTPSRDDIFVAVDASPFELELAFDELATVAGEGLALGLGCRLAVNDAVAFVLPRVDALRADAEATGAHVRADLLRDTRPAVAAAVAQLRYEDLLGGLGSTPPGLREALAAALPEGLSLLALSVLSAESAQGDARRAAERRAAENQIGIAEIQRRRDRLQAEAEEAAALRQLDEARGLPPLDAGPRGALARLVRHKAEQSARDGFRIDLLSPDRGRRRNALVSVIDEPVQLRIEIGDHFGHLTVLLNTSRGDSQLFLPHPLIADPEVWFDGNETIVLPTANMRRFRVQLGPEGTEEFLALITPADLLPPDVLNERDVAPRSLSLRQLEALVDTLAALQPEEWGAATLVYDVVGHEPAED